MGVNRLSPGCECCDVPSSSSSSVPSSSGSSASSSSSVILTPCSLCGASAIGAVLGPIQKQRVTIEMTGWAALYSWFGPGPAIGTAELHEVEGLEALNGTFVFEQDVNPAGCPPFTTWQKSISLASLNRIVDSQTNDDFCTIVHNFSVTGGIAWIVSEDPTVTGGLGVSCGTALPVEDCDNLLDGCEIFPPMKAQITNDPSIRAGFGLVCTAPARTGTNSWYRERVVEMYVQVREFDGFGWFSVPDQKIGEYTEKVTAEFVT